MFQIITICLADVNTDIREIEETKNGQYLKCLKMNVRPSSWMEITSKVEFFFKSLFYFGGKRMVKQFISQVREGMADY